jgi:transcription initiation factor TFIID subunit 2
LRIYATLTSRSIPQEDARDLSLIKSKFEGNPSAYTKAKDVDIDVELMLENARVFNGEGAVTDAANAFGRWWAGQRAKME